MDTIVRQADRIAQRFTYDACRERHSSLVRAAQYAQWFIEALQDSGLPAKRDHGSDVSDALRVVLDALGDAHGLIINDGDAEKIAPEMFPLDTAELQAALAHIERRKA